jgi:hypothetical protein
MSDYLVTILEHETPRASIADTARRLEESRSYVGTLRASGAYVDGGRLRPSSEGRRVRKEGDRMIVESGPFEGEVLAAFHHVSAPSLDAATDIARGFPRALGDAVEVRPPMKANVRPDKDAVAGKVFALAVLGRAQSEEAWTKVMDRIDAETSDGFPETGFLGGMRLQSPKSGRRITASKDGGLVLDGPFMEAKEIIGGLFFLRLPGIDEAVSWAKQTAFVTHGTLEIRELWRA